MEHSVQRESFACLPRVRGFLSGGGSDNCARLTAHRGRPLKGQASFSSIFILFATASSHTEVRESTGMTTREDCRSGSGAGEGGGGWSSFSSKLEATLCRASNGVILGEVVEVETAEGAKERPISGKFLGLLLPLPP